MPRRPIAYFSDPDALVPALETAEGRAIVAFKERGSPRTVQSVGGRGLLMRSGRG